MTKSEFISALTSSPFGEPTDYNSCNAWGFGGVVGQQWTFNGVRVRIGKACYRHLKPEAVVVVYSDTQRIFDELQRDTKWDKLLDYVFYSAGITKTLGA